MSFIASTRFIIFEEMEEQSRAQRMLYVGGLEGAVTENVLKAAFIPFGEVVDVQIPMDHVARKCIPTDVRAESSIFCQAQESTLDPRTPLA